MLNGLTHTCAQFRFQHIDLTIQHHCLNSEGKANLYTQQNENKTKQTKQGRSTSKLKLTAKISSENLNYHPKIRIIKRKKKPK